MTFKTWTLRLKIGTKKRIFSILLPFFEEHFLLKIGSKGSNDHLWDSCTDSLWHPLDCVMYQRMYQECKECPSFLCSSSSSSSWKNLFWGYQKLGRNHHHSWYHHCYGHGHWSRWRKGNGSKSIDKRKGSRKEERTSNRNVLEMFFYLFFQFFLFEVSVFMDIIRSSAGRCLKGVTHTGLLVNPMRFNEQRCRDQLSSIHWEFIPRLQLC